MELLVVGGVVVIAVLVMSSIGGSIPPAPPSAPPAAPPIVDMLMAERGLLLTKLDLDLQALELRLRQSNAVQAAEGAALVRARAVEFLKGYK